MPRERAGEGNNPSSDIGWKFADADPNNRHKMWCKFCSKEINGGITRLKQHLAHLKGNVAPCPSVSADVKRDMMAHLKESKNKQIENRKRKEDVGDYIRSTQSDDFEPTNSDDDSDSEMAHVRKQSLYDHHRWEERERSRFGGAGGSGSQRGPTGPLRSSSLREPRSRFNDLNTPQARLAAVDVDLHRARAPKQTKLNSSILKTLRKKLGTAVSQWVIFGKQPATAVTNPWFEPMLDAAREVGRGVKLPTPYEINEIYLPKEVQNIKNWIESQKPMWEERGVTIMCDGWSGPTRKHLINFLVHCDRTTVFLKSIDATDVVSRTADYYFSLMDKVVEEVGEKYVVQIVTDNEAAVKAGGKKLMEKRPHLYWTGCAAHCIDLILEDIGKKKNVASVLGDAREITSFIYNHTWVVDFMKRFTNSRELLRPAVTRFATNFITLESILKHKEALKMMFNSTEWASSRYSKLEGAKKSKKIIQSDSFWDKAADICKVQEPLVKVLRLVDGDEKPTMGFIYEAMDRAKLAIQRDCRHWSHYWKIIDKRWQFQLHKDLHSAGYYLNPQFQYDVNMNMNNEVMEGVRNVIQRLEPDIDNQIKAINQMLLFRDRQESFGGTLAQKAVLRTNPAEWWIHYGTSAPELQRIAIRVLSQTTSSSNCERNWSTFGLIHTKTRNRLKSQKLNKLVYCYYNMRLKIRNATRRSQAEIEAQFNPINLDYIFDEDDPLAPWLEERESPVLDGQNNSWLSDDDDGLDSAGAPTNIRSGSGSGSGSHGALSPPSDDDNDGGIGGTGGGTVNFHSGDNRETSPYQGEHGSYGLRDEVEESIDRPVNVYTRTSRTRGPTEAYEPNASPNLTDNFGMLNIGAYHPPQSSYPVDATTYPVPPQYYYPPHHPNVYPPHQYHIPPPQYHIPPPTLPNYQHGYIVLPVPQGYYGQSQQFESSGSQNYFVQQETSNSSASQNNSGRIEESTSSNNYGMAGSSYFGGESSENVYNDDDAMQIDPPRNSFWY